ncbi:uncharacterized protein H6S33_006781 [Morchella sextelata]|uniref:uncharacterized protein n=1 Tax=Morchella sextelata TaxID=1174677 RepID=UPI001D0414A2|nr:uncharacterized protein H6S33_006781 [Morchella sextelata]KAH0604404.1 hypothetical protein H6S33_006781 [Morchella sextelata]
MILAKEFISAPAQKTGHLLSNLEPIQFWILPKPQNWYSPTVMVWISIVDVHKRGPFRRVLDVGSCESQSLETVRFVAIVESGGPDYITVHGRRRSQRSSEPVNLEAIRLIKSVAKVPIVANGDVFCLDDVDRIIKATRVDGVMAARGLMENPALFAGYSTTPWGAVEKFLHLNMTLGPLPHQLTVHHVGEMMLKMLNKKERSSMVDSSSNTVELLDWLDERFVLARPSDEGFGKGVHAVRIV